MTSTSRVLLSLEKVCYTYPKSFFSLKNISFNVYGGESVFIYGLCGSGKSTLAKIICNLLLKSSGEIVINTLNPFMVFQDIDNQFIRLNVSDDLAFGPENLGVPKTEIIKRISYYSDLFSIKHLLDRKISTLSSSEKVRVAICSALCTNAKILVLDEVYSYLDMDGIDEIRNILKICLEMDMCILNFSQNIHLASKSDRLLVLKNGVLCS